MARLVWSLHAYQYFAGRATGSVRLKKRVHAVNRQLELGSQADRTLCGGLLPAQPHWQALERQQLRTAYFCPQCRDVIQTQRKQAQPGWRSA